MSLANILGIISLFVLIVVTIITVATNYKMLKEIESLFEKQRNILMILINARINKEAFLTTIKKIEKALVSECKSDN